jgi:NAD(P)-dependent dehydrogenase (short-subunit alcohol dehydrogenase family)
MAETRRVAIVTGAAGGIGRAMVRGLLGAGIRVAAVDRDREPLELDQLEHLSDRPRVLFPERTEGRTDPDDAPEPPAHPA